jgi:hypothetical protein
MSKTSNRVAKCVAKTEDTASGHMPPLGGPLVITELKCTCSSCPTQWEGWTDDRRQIYVRYRHGYLSIRVGKPDDAEEFAAVRGKKIFGKQLGGEFDGILEPEELLAATDGVITLRLTKGKVICSTTSA